MVREIKEPKLSGKLKKLASSSFFIPVVLLFFFVLTIPVISLFTSHQQDIRQHAAGAGPTASINTTPLSGNVTVGQTFTVDVVVDGGGQSFNAAQANVAASSNLTIQSVTLTPPTSGGCNFTYVNQGSTPSIAHPSFVGAILNGASTKCTAYTITLVGNASGTGNVTITSGSVKSSVDHSEIFLSSGNGLFTIGTTKVNPLAQSVMSLSPSTGSVVSGQSIVVDVRINTNGETVNGVQTNITYPPSLLSVASINSSSGVFDVKAQQTDDGNGNIALGFGAFTPQNGSNLLVATITFVSKAQGSANVNFANSSVISDISNQDVLKNVINGT
ncbi:MAG: cohesin domain-containing protein, partial [Ferruginibacter sp.]